jgi:hypothetical protein
MRFRSLLALCIFAAVGFVSITQLFVRIRPHGDALPRNSRFGFFRGGGLGNALQQLQVIVHPHTKHVIVQMAAEEADESEAEGAVDPADPIAHLHRQAEKIRRGEEIDRITALLAKQE